MKALAQFFGKESNVGLICLVACDDWVVFLLVVRLLVRPLWGIAQSLLFHYNYTVTLGKTFPLVPWSFGENYEGWGSRAQFPKGVTIFFKTIRSCSANF